MKNLVEFLVNHLVIHPEDIQVEETELNNTTVCNVSVNEEDMKNVIGYRGKKIKAIRRIASIPCSLQGRSSKLVLEE